MRPVKIRAKIDAERPRNVDQKLMAPYCKLAVCCSDSPRTCSRGMERVQETGGKKKKQKTRKKEKKGSKFLRREKNCI